MRHFKLILCLVFLPCLAFADSNYYLGASGVPSSVADHCAAGCTGEADADLSCVDVETGAAECSFSDTVTGSATIEWNAAHSGTFCCADKGDYAIEFTIGAAETAYAAWNEGSANDIAAVQFYFNLVSESLADTNYARIFRVTNVDPVTTFAIAIYQDSGNLKIGTYLNNSGTDYTDKSTMNLSTGTWYRVRIFYQRNTALVGSIAACDGTGSETFVNRDSSTVGGYTAQFYQIGCNLAPGGAVNFQIDNLKTDETTAISTGCVE